MLGVCFRVVILAALAAPTVLAHATILLFDQERVSGSPTLVGPTVSGGTLPADYGDNVTGAVVPVSGGVFTYGEGGEGYTPNVTVDIYPTAAAGTDAHVGLWQSGYGDLVNVIFADGPGTAGAPMLNVRLTAASGYLVDLYGFELAGFNSDHVIAGISVFAGATELYSEPNVLVQGDVSGARHTTFAFAAPYSAPELLLQVDLSNLTPGSQDNIAMDSIRFGQTPIAAIPEPAPVALLLAGLTLVAVACHRSRRSRHGAKFEASLSRVATTVA